jgi:hypothetical protein
MDGGRDRNRTCDLQRVELLLFRLSYSPGKWWAVLGLNQRPPACKAGVLPTELTALEDGALSGIRTRHLKNAILALSQMS